MALLNSNDMDSEPSPSGRTPEARPIFVVGASRSGASLLTLSLGQHHNIEQVLETNWYERMALSLQQTYTAGIVPRETSQLDASGFDANAFSAWFGDAINRLMLEHTSENEAGTSPKRWVDGSRDLNQDLFSLVRLFPRAKIIHVFREAGEVVASFSNRENKPLYKSRYVELSTSEATSRWIQTVTACVDAERAFGSQTVLRVHRRDLVERPEEVLRRCCAFVDEPFDPAMLRAFRPLERTDDYAMLPPGLAVHHQRVTVGPAADLISKMLTEEGNPNYPGDELRQLELELAFGKRADRETRLIEPKAKTKPVNVAKADANSPSVPDEAQNGDRRVLSIMRSLRTRIQKAMSSTDRAD